MDQSFSSLGVPAHVAERLAARGITIPTPIQAAAIPDALAGRDVCGQAQTGSGKTIAFGVPLMVRTAGPEGGRRRLEPRRPTALVLVPTRELALQVLKELTGLDPGRSRETVAIFGGVGYGPQKKALERGVSLVVACPGRLEDLLAQGSLRLDAVRTVVVDEADRMADMGFLPAVRRILDTTPPQRQTLLFSATLGDAVAALVHGYQRDPAHHDVTSAAEMPADVDHVFLPTDRTERPAVTASLVAEHGRAIVFCRTRHGADRLVRQLSTAGVTSAPLHGSRSQAQRERALNAFSAGKVQALVATDVAARGIHVAGVPCVVHFDMPASFTDYLHRSGRTGRAGAPGTVVALVTPEQRKEAAGLERSLDANRERRDRPQPAAAHEPRRRDARLAEPRRRDARLAEPGRTGPVRTEARRPGPVRAEPSRSGPVRTEARHPAGRERRDGRRGTGTVTFFNESRGYGFIRDRQGRDFFVHHTNIAVSGAKGLAVNQAVSFDVGRGRKGEEALAVRPA